jgi:hypothetical protein
VRLLVDTPVWSLALRRKRGELSAEQTATVAAWAEAIRQKRVVLVGCVRQEVLSGLRDPVGFQRLREHLRALDDVCYNV